MIRKMCAIVSFAWVSYDLEYTADKMAHLLRSGLALAHCPGWREIAVVEERRRMMTDGS